MAHPVAPGTTIMGVDYSGAVADNATWITKAVLTGTVLDVICCQRIRRGALTALLTRFCINKVHEDAVVAMDFPFGVPMAFAEEFRAPGPMPATWAATANAFAADPNFVGTMRDDLGNGGRFQRFRNLLRQWDRMHFGKVAYSPLKTGGNPDMFRMTFHGMNMLHALWNQTGCRVPPLNDNGRTGPRLLEVMPGALLSSFCVPNIGYKGGGNDQLSRHVRNYILNGLITIPELALEIPNHLYDQCLTYHDCLDSVIAAIGAALWSIDETLFHRPDDHHDHAVLFSAQQEGCIYGLSRTLGSNHALPLPQ